MTYSINGNLWVKALVQVVKYATGLAGVAMIYLLAQWLRGSKSLKTIGDYSYDVYLMHNPYIVALSSMLLNKVVGIDAYVSIIVAVVLGVGLPILVSRFVIRRVPVLSRLMVGFAK